MPLVFDGKPYTVVGITPPAFRLNEDEADVFTPLGQDTVSEHAESRQRIPDSRFGASPVRRDAG